MRKIYRKFFAWKVERMGMEHDEVLQLVYLRLLRANRGRSPFDPRRASLGRYLYLVIDSTLKNLYKQSVSPKYASELLGGREDAAELAEASEADGADPLSALCEADEWPHSEPAPPPVTSWRR